MPVVAILVLLTLGAPPVQTVTPTTGAANGVAIDSSQAVVPGVVVLSGPSLLTPQSVTTDEGGAYRFSAVPPGDYTLTFTLDGFDTIARMDVGGNWAALSLDGR